MQIPKKLLNNSFQFKGMELLIDRYSHLQKGEPLKHVLEKLEKNPLIKKITFKSNTIITYSPEEVKLLRDYLNILSTIKISIEKSLSSCKCKYKPNFSLAYEDPISFLSHLLKEKRRPSCKCDSYTNTLKKSIELLESNSFVSNLKEEGFSYLKAYEQSKFSSTLFYAGFSGKIIDSYSLEDGSKISIIDDGSSYIYEIKPAEILLNKEETYLVSELIEMIEKNASLLLEENPRKKVNELVRNALLKKIKPSQKVRAEIIPSIIEIVVRNTIGYGALEALLLDENIQDIFINREEEFIYISHSKYEEMMTNIVPSLQDIKEWSTKIKLENNKPLDETHPVLDGNIYNKKSLVRVSLMHPPLSTKGISFSIRKHREIPITLPFLVKEGTLSPKAAAYLSISAIFGRSLLIAGSRGSGKTTLLGSLLFELPPKYRVVIVEDTLELPVDSLLKNNYNVVSMKSKSFLSISEYDVEAQDALRASLRFGDSCLIIGEARGKEVIALYEAMRVGALSNFVSGTLHAESPYGVYDRVVNDLGVKNTSFKATDMIAILSLLKGPSSLKRKRKLLSITELKDDWSNDPMEENAFITTTELRKDKYKYSFEKSVVLDNIAKKLPSGYDKKYLLKLIEIKEKQIKDIIELSKKNKKYLYPDFVIKANSYLLSSLESKNPYSKWKEFLKGMRK